MKELIKLYLDIKTEYDIEKETIADMKEKMDALKEEITSRMSVDNLKSARFNEGTATLATRKTSVITDEKKVVEYLKELDLNMYIAERLTDEGVNAVKLIKEPVEGIEVKETSYLSIKSPTNENQLD